MPVGAATGNTYWTCANYTETEPDAKKKKFTWTDNTLKGKKKVGKLTHPMLPFTIHDTIIEWQCYALNIQNNLIFKRT